MKKITTLLADDKKSRILIPLLTIAMSVVVASIMLLMLGKNPIAAFAGFLQGCGLLPKPTYGNGKGMITDLLSFLGIMAPMLLASLGVAIGMQTGLFNIGVSGQMLSAGLIATVVVGYSGMSAAVAKPVALLIGALVGCLLGAFVGFLKYKFNIHEVVSTIMLNYIINYISGFYINAYIADPITRASKVCSAASRLTVMGVEVGGYKLNIPLGIVVALIGVVIVWFLLEKTVMGFELKAVGKNRDCARYDGINVNKSIVISMSLSGLFAGLAGIAFYMGYYNQIVPKTLSSLGYDSIAVSLLGNNSPFGCIFSSFLITIFQSGSVYMSSTTGVNKEIASVIVGILLLFSACGGYIQYTAKRKQEKYKAEAASRKEVEKDA